MSTNNKSKEVSGYCKRKRKEKKDLEFKKIKGSMDAFIKKKTVDTGM